MTEVGPHMDHQPHQHVWHQLHETLNLPSVLEKNIKPVCHFCRNGFLLPVFSKQVNFLEYACPVMG